VRSGRPNAVDQSTNPAGGSARTRRQLLAGAGERPVVARHNRCSKPAPRAS